MGLDSLDALEIVLCIENSFGIKVPTRIHRYCSITVVDLYLRAGKEGRMIMRVSPTEGNWLQPEHSLQRDTVQRSPLFFPIIRPNIIMGITQG